MEPTLRLWASARHFFLLKNWSDKVQWSPFCNLGSGDDSKKESNHVRSADAIDS